MTYTELEMSGEIKMAHPNTNVSIVHAGRLPVSDEFPDSFRKKALQALQDDGVKLILNEKVNLDTIGEKGQVRLSSGKTLPADLVVVSKYSLATDS